MDFPYEGHPTTNVDKLSASKSVTAAPPVIILQLTKTWVFRQWRKPIKGKHLLTTKLPSTFFLYYREVQTQRVKTRCYFQLQLEKQIRGSLWLLRICLGVPSWTNCSQLEDLSLWGPASIREVYRWTEPKKSNEWKTNNGRSRWSLSSPSSSTVRNQPLFSLERFRPSLPSFGYSTCSSARFHGPRKHHSSTSGLPEFDRLPPHMMHMQDNLQRHHLMQGFPSGGPPPHHSPNVNNQISGLIPELNPSQGFPFAHHQPSYGMPPQGITNDNPNPFATLPFKDSTSAHLFLDSKSCVFGLDSVLMSNYEGTSWFCIWSLKTLFFILWLCKFSRQQSWSSSFTGNGSSSGT